MNRALLHRSGRWSGPLFISLAIALDLSQADATAQEITRPGRPLTQLTEDARILQLQERDRHRNEAVRLANSGRLDEAVREMEATLGVGHYGQGVLGLQRAFHAAGAAPWSPACGRWTTLLPRC
jgi:hypothetical protein